MAALRLLKREEWEAELAALRCKKYDAGHHSGLETAEWWVTEHDRLFAVACDEHGYVRIDDWQQVSNKLAKLKPLDWDT